jgi:hypothetical protein
MTHSRLLFQATIEAYSRLLLYLTPCKPTDNTEAMNCTLLHQYIFLTGVSQQQLKEAHNFSIIPIFSLAAMAGESNSSSPNSRGMGHVP